MYDAADRRFVSIDPILDGTKYDLSEYTTEAINFTAYVYVQDNPLRWVDPLGLIPLRMTGEGVNLRRQVVIDKDNSLIYRAIGPVFPMYSSVSTGRFRARRPWATVRLTTL